MTKHLTIGIIGDYSANRKSQVTTGQSLEHVSREVSIDIETVWLSTAGRHNRSITKDLAEMDAVWAGPGDYADSDTVFTAITDCREWQKPFFAT